MAKLLGRMAGVLLLIALIAGGTFYYQPIAVSDLIIRLHLREQRVQSRYVDVDGYKLHYFEALPPSDLRALGEGRPLVLIHGLGSRGEDWAGMIPGLAAAGFHVYAPDLLGYGRSSQPDSDYSIALEEKTVVDFMQAVHLDRVDVGGWSMGGWIALKLTIDHPSLVKRLVVYDSAGIYFPPTFDASLFTPEDVAGVAKLSAMLTPHPKPLPGFVSRAAVRKLKENAWVIRRSVHAMEGGKDLLDFQLHRVHRPTLIVWGDDDRLIPLSTGEQMHRAITDSNLLVVEGCGHLAPAECTKPVLAGTISFLRAYPPPGGVESAVPGIAGGSANHERNYRRY